MTKNFVKGLLAPAKSLEGFDINSVVDDIFAAASAQLDDLRTKKDGEIATLKGQIKELEDERDEMLNTDTDGEFEGKYKTEKAAHDATKAELEAEKTAHATTKTDHETKATNAALLEKIHAAAIEAGKLDQLGVKALKKHGLDMSIVKHKSGEITNLDDVLKHYQDDELVGALWGKEQRTEGAGNGNPPPSKDTGADKNFSFEFTPVRPMPTQATPPPPKE